VIKLVAADMDGTLLNSKKELPKKLFSTITQLHDNQIKFAVASGRQYYNLLKLYQGIADKVTFIAENGAVVFDQGEILFYDEIAYEDVVEILNAVNQIDHAYPVLCGLESAYIQAQSNDDFKMHVDMYYTRCERVADLLAVAKKDRICKVAVYDSVNAETNAYPGLSCFRDRFKVVVSGHQWVDVMNATVNKGIAIKMLQKKYGIQYDETMTFGDYLNDYEMMQACEHSYAMANAHPQLKAVANYEAPSNDEEGVITVLENYLQTKR